ncbi:hypothetical protein ACERII_22820 [Evansella sp. AB-rgal1]|uniref:hypothetical protein n=1 Tax=Evansella sp. AB-rgal1 TaxID=3242696 RepID=UPI00359D7559
MKLVFQAIICSIIIHVVYISSIIFVGYIKTRNYVPDIASSYESVEYLQNEVTFGVVFSPFFFLFTFVGVAAICGCILYFYKNWSLKQ